MAENLKCVCNDCGRSFDKMIGGTMKSEMFQCKKCFSTELISNSTIKDYDKVCKSCGGEMSIEGIRPVCPNCKSTNVRSEHAGYLD